MFRLIFNFGNRQIGAYRIDIRIFAYDFLLQKSIIDQFLLISLLGFSWLLFCICVIIELKIWVIVQKPVKHCLKIRYSTILS